MATYCGLILSAALCLCTANAAPAEKEPAPASSPASAESKAGKAPAYMVPAIPAKFRHPGLLHNLDELREVRRHIEAGDEPWKTAFQVMKETKWASLTYKPRPRETVSSGFSGSGGGAGGSFDQSDDAIAAYTQSLMWILTGDERHAEKAVEILNAWSILKNHEGPNWYMMAQWTGSILPQSAELIRATYPKWAKEDIAKFSEMLNTAFLPTLHRRLSYGNREFGVINALVAIGVFNNDRAAFAEGVSHWVSYVPCWIYLKEDGPEPIRPNYWETSPTNDELARLNEGFVPDVKKSWIYADTSVTAMMKEKKLGDDRTMMLQYDKDKSWHKAPPAAFVDGLCAETFRDLGHCDLGFAQLINTAEIAWHQGIDLYSIHAKRITAFMEFYSFLRMGDPLPKEFYRVQSMGMNATFEIAYNHYHNRLGMELPRTKELIAKAIRPCLAKKPNISPGWSTVDPEPGIRASQMCYPAVLAIAWETLTHAERGGSPTPAAGNAGNEDTTVAPGALTPASPTFTPATTTTPPAPPPASTTALEPGATPSASVPSDQPRKKEPSDIPAIRLDKQGHPARSSLISTRAFCNAGSRAPSACCSSATPLRQGGPPLKMSGRNTTAPTIPPTSASAAIAPRTCSGASRTASSTVFRRRSWCSSSASTTAAARKLRAGPARSSKRFAPNCRNPGYCCWESSRTAIPLRIHRGTPPPAPVSSKPTRTSPHWTTANTSASSTSAPNSSMRTAPSAKTSCPTVCTPAPPATRYGPTPCSRYWRKC